MATSYGNHFFEGTEKLLEVWFTRSDNDVDSRDLRNIDRSHWEELLKLVKCEIISFKQNEDLDAYLLSESSMFISKHRFILKTCGTTTLLLAVKPLLKLVKEQTGLDKVDDVFYSRKKFMKPELQHDIHQNWEDEVDFLDTLFENGASYALGRTNRDCWYLYTIDSIGVTQPDQTLEILMTELDDSVMDIFTKSVSKDGPEASKTDIQKAGGLWQDCFRKSGIADMISGVVMDDFLFEPCGYSMNGLLPGGNYITVHITPEKEFSYVSFETNLASRSYQTLIGKILSAFKPGKFLMTLFANKNSVAVDNYRVLENSEYFLGYKRQDHQLCQFKNYNLTYTHYALHNSPNRPPAPPY